jgi:ferritin
MDKNMLTEVNTIRHKMGLSLLKEGIEDEARISKKILGLLNTQIKLELESSQLYRSISCWLDEEGWVTASKYYFTSAQEELKHMDKIYEYIFDKNGRAVTPGSEKPKGDFKDIKTIVVESLKHEMGVTENWNNIANAAMSEKDNDTYALSQWFLAEQIEEEAKFRDFIFRMRLDMPKYEIDEMFGE